jgi:hypothetical protein
LINTRLKEPYNNQHAKNRKRRKTNVTTTWDRTKVRLAIFIYKIFFLFSQFLLEGQNVNLISEITSFFGDLEGKEDKPIYDTPSHVIFVTDWMSTGYMDSYLPGYYEQQYRAGQFPDSFLVNGRGLFYNVSLGDEIDIDRLMIIDADFRTAWMSPGRLIPSSKCRKIIATGSVSSPRSLPFAQLSLWWNLMRSHLSQRMESQSNQQKLGLFICLPVKQLLT